MYPYKHQLGIRSLHLYISSLPNSPIFSQIKRVTCIKVGSLRWATNKAIYSHHVNFSIIEGDEGRNGKAKGDTLICLMTIMYKYLSQDIWCMGILLVYGDIALFFPFALSILEPNGIFWVFALSL